MFSWIWNKIKSGINWFTSKGWKYTLGAILGYGLHLAIESFILTNLLAKIGLSIPVLV